mgnify:CR=1 FL=1
MKVLVTGGAGYIGSHMVKLLLARGIDVVTIDDLSCGHREAVVGGDFVLGDVGDRACMTEVLGRWRFDAIMHFASFIQVGESVRDPAKYYRNNLAGTLTLLDSAVAAGVKRFVFSSSAAIFGEPRYTPIDEAHPTQPISPYGYSKLAIERILADYDHAYGLRSVCLRYFNAAGADPSGELGERHEPESHLIPLVLQAASGRRSSVSIYGNDYPTPDGTCVRDYVHIVDLCEAHLLALEQMQQSDRSAAYNLGNNRGYSVSEVVRAVETVAQRRVRVELRGRRPGDPAVLVADANKAITELNWRPRFNDIETIVAHAWGWEQRQLRDKRVAT